ncbi:MAG: type II toxin-antitoxin system PemK/MazF family toxin [Synergistaceae bacterium]|nr:type II toxin-antitoxin system PemK/MazF family toxin [Synergistaceae bacterium]
MARISVRRARAVVTIERGDICLVSLDPTSGHEQRGRRPVLVVSPGSFNRMTGTPIVLPITSGGRFARTIGFSVSLNGCGTETTGVIRCDQPRAMDLESRGATMLERVPDEIMIEVLARLTTIFTL